MKTAVSVLQEMLMKLGETPQYECIAQSGSHHSTIFEYRCKASGTSVSATARSKKEAKQKAARLMLLELSSLGDPVPAPYCLSHANSAPHGSGAGAGPSRSTNSSQASVAPSMTSYIALLKELCDEYRLPKVFYELMSDTGPPHRRQFTIRVKLGQVTRYATSSSKKAARQQAAEQLYKFLRENISSLPRDVVECEEEAHMSTCEHDMESPLVNNEEPPKRRMHLNQVVADYHLALTTQTDPEKVIDARIILDVMTKNNKSDEEILEAVVEVLGLTVTRSFPDSKSKTLCILEISPTTPELTFAGLGCNSAITTALRYLRLALNY